MKKLIILLSFLCIRQTKAQTYVLIPDANFATYLQGLIPSAMSGNSLNTTSTLVTTSTQSLIPNNLGISNLSGVQYFTSLTYLNCSYNSLSTLPSLPNSLHTLYCEANSLTALPSLPNSLQSLDCNANSLTSLPALSNSLQILSCNTNSLTNLPALPNSLLTLYCDSNKIACFPVFPNSITNILLFGNPYNCLPNYVLPAMSGYTTIPLCAPGNTNGCAVATGVKELNANNNDISIYPNPANGEFIVEAISTEKQMMQLFDLNGKLVISENINGKATIDVSNLNTGVYNLTLKSGEGVLNKKLIIVK